MTEFNSYPVFVADQVLSADHLNEIVNYLDEQDRLTRNKLIGIGIVCGLELIVDPTQIVITKGCGVTSSGYLIVQDELTLQYYQPYTLPGDFFPKYKPIYEAWTMWELLTAQQSLEFEDTEAIKGSGEFMRDKIVVLLLEMKNSLLKNCVDTDCDDKGRKIEFAVKPLLVRRTDIDKFLKGLEDSVSENEPLPVVNASLPDIQLRRFNVPVRELTSSDLVMDAFLQLTDDAMLKRLADALNLCFMVYHPILLEESANPFLNVLDILKNTLATIKSANPFFIQYYYDWIDDLIKAYDEFKCKVYDVQVMCCPDEDLFPLHLMLGEATKSTSINVKSNYRHYFIYSPLFNGQKNLLGEVQLLFKRLKQQVKNYVVLNPNTFPRTPIKITPSKYRDHPLSDRCIPYYYQPLDTYPFWSYDKSRKGKAQTNLSYNAKDYTSDDAVINPLNYDIERYDFFRVEGHIGKNYSQALSAIIGQRNQFNLPFEAVALSTATVARFVASEDTDCVFKDLESLYQVIIAEMICRFGDVACMLGNAKYSPRFTEVVTGVFTTAATSGLFATLARPNLFSEVSLATGLSPSVLAALSNLASLKTPAYKKGDFIRNHCSIGAGTMADAYLKMVERNFNFTKPSPDSQMNLNTVYAHLFYFIDCVENVMGASWPYELKDFNSTTFANRFKDLTEETRVIASLAPSILDAAKELGLEESMKRFPGLINTCFDERLEALRKEFEKRQKELQALINFMNYFKKHPGMEHKAGVPKGGTFILVYHETPPRRPVRPLRPDLLTNVAGTLSTNISRAANIDFDMLTTASVKDPELLKRFEVALGRYVDTCRDIDDETKLDIKDLLITIPSIRVPTKFQIPEFSVIADFYLPYLCCSDCAPITYVLPKVQEGVLSIRISPTEFCNIDEKTYPVIVSPEGGSLSASAGGVDPAKLEFRPLGIAAGVNKLTYTLADGRSTSTDVTVTEGFKVEFKFTVQDDGVTVLFKPAKLGERKPFWDFGDGTTSTETEPKHTYQFGERERSFTVKLTVTDGPCLSTVEHSFTLVKPERAEFGIIPQVFSFTDKTRQNFTTVPVPSNVNEIKNPDNLRVDLSAAGVLSFVPLKQELAESKNFNLEYKGLPLTVSILAANADFTMKLSSVPANDDTLLLLTARQDDADTYEWKILVRDRTLNFSGRKVEVFYRKLEISVQDEITILLTVGRNVPGAVCEAEEKFLLTTVIFRKFLNKDEFDNHIDD
ncbi:MAG TPA: PKD domain-containing protein [Cyclobacteriaceae bacterium]|nr:PKD domain-containing protein [Cyclobacteriaceae bacterium]